MLSTVTDPDLLELLNGFIDPVSGKTLSETKMVESATFEDGSLQIVLKTPSADPIFQKTASALEHAVQKNHKVKKTTIILTAHRPSPASPPTGSAVGHRPLNINHMGGNKRLPAAGPLLSNVKSIIAIASGKGGVGKSSTAINLAVGLGIEGLKVGLLDADVHGPSIPKMLGLQGKPDAINGMLQPMPAWGIQTMSIGSLVKEEDALIWRGPMVMGAITQLLGDVSWPDLDVLIIDMPPGTGDAQLTLTQKLNLAGAIIVSTPQDIALLDARRGIHMFQKTNVPILGLIENMAYFCCPNCGHKTELFGHGGARMEAEKLNVPFLGEIPLLANIRSTADKGTPIIAALPQSEAAQAYQVIVTHLAKSLRKQNHS